MLKVLLLLSFFSATLTSCRDIQISKCSEDTNNCTSFLEVALADPDNFVVIWKTDATPPAYTNYTDNKGAQLPLTEYPLNSNDFSNDTTKPECQYDFTVNWGDGESSEITAWNDPDIEHQYSSPGEYVISMNGQIDCFILIGKIGLATQAGQSDFAKVIDIKQWGSNKFQTMSKMFFATQISGFSAKDVPDLSEVTDLSYMLFGNTVFNSNIN